MKAEDRALEKYPFMSNNDKEGLEALKYIGMECESAFVFNEAQEAKQRCFIEGYRQAEKDLALTLVDIRKICLIAREIHKYYGFWSDIVYQEVLKRFKATKD